MTRSDGFLAALVACRRSTSDMESPKLNDYRPSGYCLMMA
jgi:hypothetical protein